MKLKALFSSLILFLIGTAILMQTNVILAIASDPNNPITAAITNTINDITGTPSPTPTSSPSSEPISVPIVNPSSTPAPTPTPTSTNAPGTYLVKPYLVYPADKTTYPEYETAVKNYLAELQGWYKRKVGATFNVSPLQVIKSNENYLALRCGLNPSQACLNDPSKLEGNVGAYVNKAIHNGVEKWDEKTATLVFAAGAGGYAGANKYANDTGFAIVGDWVLEPLSRKANDWGIPCKYSDGWQCNGFVPEGTPAHELGHAFGLPHPDTNLYPGDHVSIMRWHGDYPTVGFLPNEINLLKESPFFQTNVVVAPVISTIFPNPATWLTIIAVTGTNFTNSTQVYLDNGHTYQINPDDIKPVTANGTGLGFTLPVLGDQNKKYKLYVVQNGIKSNEVDLTVAPSVLLKTATPSANQVIVDPQVSLDSSHPELYIAHSNFNVNVSIPKSVTNPTINFSDILTSWGSSVYAAFNNNLTINAVTSLGTVKMEIPASTSIEGPASWNGIMNAPKILDNTEIKPTADSGTTVTTQSVIEVGLGDTPLTFDKAVRILIPGQAGKLVGYQRGSVFTKIATSCSADTQTAGDDLPAKGDCFISVGADLVIWTKHFTKFATYTQSSNNNSTSQSTSGGNAGAPICGDSKPVSTPKLVYAAATGRNEVTLVWSKALDPVSYYLVTYGTKSNQMEYGNPNIGNKDTTSYIVKGLSNGKTYYFKVRAGNGCMPGEFSNEIAVKVSGNNLSGPALGFKSGVLSSNNEGPKFMPITAVNTNRIVTSSANLFDRLVNFFTRLFRD